MILSLLHKVEWKAWFGSSVRFAEDDAGGKDLREEDKRA
jgi:hypothetical protein